MAKKVKCQRCNKQLDKDEAYLYIRITKAGKIYRKYYCSREEFHQERKNKRDYKKCQYATDDILGYPIVNNIRNKMLVALNENFSYEMILDCINFYKSEIKTNLERKNINVEYQKLRYIFSILENNIKDFEMQYKAHQRSKKILEEIEIAPISLRPVTETPARNKRRSLKDRLGK